MEDKKKEELKEEKANSNTNDSKNVYEKENKIEKSEKEDVKAKKEKTNEKNQESTKNEKANASELKKEAEEEKVKTVKDENRSTFKVVKPNENEAEKSKSVKEETKVEKEENKSKTSKKKKGKGIKVFCVILLILILLVAIHYLKNKMTLENILNTSQNYTNSQNFEYKKEISSENTKSSTEVYYLNGMYKITNAISENREITVVTMQNKVALFINNNGNKAVAFQDKGKSGFEEAVNLQNNLFKAEKWTDYMFSTIKSANEDENEYYVICNPFRKYGFVSSDENDEVTKAKTTKYYINKETGLIEKIELLKSDKTVVATVNYHYAFNSVIQSDLGMPDIASYKLAE